MVNSGGMAAFGLSGRCRGGCRVLYRRRGVDFGCGGEMLRWLTKFSTSMRMAIIFQSTSTVQQQYEQSSFPYKHSHVAQIETFVQFIPHYTRHLTPALTACCQRRVHHNAFSHGLQLGEVPEEVCRR